MTFRLKLLLSMVLLVIGITATTLLITENLVRLSYERHFQQSFGFQIDLFLQQREARLEPIKERVSAAAASTRLFAAMENALQDHADQREAQRDIDDLYQNGMDQLSEVMAGVTSARTNKSSWLFFFLNSKGELLYPSPQDKLPFSLLGLRAISREVESVGVSVSHQSGPEIGYLAPEAERGTAAIREMVFTPIVDQVGHQKLGVLAVGFPLPNPAQGNPILSAIWIANRLHASSIPADALNNI